MARIATTIDGLCFPMRPLRVASVRISRSRQRVVRAPSHSDAETQAAPDRRRHDRQPKYALEENGDYWRVGAGVWVGAKLGAFRCRPGGIAGVWFEISAYF